jgi:hypothetical protein
MTVIASADTIEKALTLEVIRLSEGSFHVESSSVPGRMHTVRNTPSGLLCSCPAGSINTVCAHRVAVSRMAEIRKARVSTVDPATMTEAELCAMSVGELAVARNRATILNRDIAAAREVEGEKLALLTVKADRAKRLGQMKEHHEAREAAIIQKQVCEALAIRQAAMKTLVTTLQNALRTQQETGG